jgi:hypothetical protein
MDSRAAIHMAGQPLLPVSTNSRTWDTLINQQRSVAIKSQPEPTQSVAGWPLCPPLTFGLAPRGLQVTNILVVTLSLVEFQILF